MARILDPHEMNGVTLIFDGSCGFCARSVRWMQRRDHDGRLTVLPSQMRGLLSRYGLTRDEVTREAWTVDGNGKRYRGAAAINRAMAELPGPWRLVAWLYGIRPIGWVEDGAYRWIADHRQLLSRLWHDPECAVFTGPDA